LVQREADAVNERLYKLTSEEGAPLHGGSGKWSLPKGDKPGAWRSVKGKLVPCENGLHLLRAQNISTWLLPGVLWEVKAGRERIDHGDKTVVRRARLVRRAATIDDKVLRLLAADFAEHVLPIFEKRYPKDMRPRDAIAAARAYARGEIGVDELREKQIAYAAYAADAAAAAYAAAYGYAAAAAYAAAYGYAAAAAYAAAAGYADAAAYGYAAAYAADAYAAARQQERAWQASRVVGVLGLADAPKEGAG
jgi:hypothetical protein